MNERLTPPLQRVITKLEEGTLSPHQVERIHRFLEFDKPPEPGDNVDAIAVMGTSPIWDSKSFNLRITYAKHYGNQFPNAAVIFTGRHPDISRAIEEELQSQYSEAEAMRNAAHEIGFIPENEKLEEESLNTRENVFNTLRLIIPEIQDHRINSVLLISSSYSGRRIDLYMKKAIQELGLEGLKYFILDGDVQEDRYHTAEFNPAEKLRKNYYRVYEWQRLPGYRKQGYL